MAPVERRNVRTNTMLSAILAVLFAINILASHSQIYRLPKNSFIFEKYFHWRNNGINYSIAGNTYTVKAWLRLLLIIKRIIKKYFT